MSKPDPNVFQTPSPDLLDMDRKPMSPQAHGELTENKDARTLARYEYAPKRELVTMWFGGPITPLDQDIFGTILCGDDGYHLGEVRSWYDKEQALAGHERILAYLLQRPDAELAELKRMANDCLDRPAPLWAVKYGERIVPVPTLRIAELVLSVKSQRPISLVLWPGTPEQHRREEPLGDIDEENPPFLWRAPTLGT